MLLPDKILQVGKKPKLLGKSLGGYLPSFQDEMLLSSGSWKLPYCIELEIVHVIFVSIRPYFERDLESCLIIALSIC